MRQNGFSDKRSFPFTIAEGLLNENLQSSWNSRRMKISFNVIGYTAEWTLMKTAFYKCDSLHNKINVNKGKQKQQPDVSLRKSIWIICWKSGTIELKFSNAKWNKWLFLFQAVSEWLFKGNKSSKAREIETIIKLHFYVHFHGITFSIKTFVAMKINSLASGHSHILKMKLWWENFK